MQLEHERHSPIATTSLMVGARKRNQHGRPARVKIPSIALTDDNNWIVSLPNQQLAFTPIEEDIVESGMAGLCARTTIAINLFAQVTPPM